jgi:hypothetical protein
VAGIEGACQGGEAGGEEGGEACGNGALSLSLAMADCLREAGGVVVRLDGAPCRPADPGGGVSVTPPRAICDQVAAMLGE